MIFDASAQPLLEKYKSAREAEAVATKNLLAALQSGVNDSKTLESLSDNMEAAHNRSMDIWDQLQLLALGQ